LPLSASVDPLDDEDMLLAILLTAGSVGLLVAMGWLTDELLGDQADRWATRIARTDTDESSEEKPSELRSGKWRS
jgi:hypothetical protein